MQLLVARPVIKRLERELRRAGRRESGGLLMGEHLRDELFRLVELSVQRGGGTDVCFIRRPQDHKAQLEKFFAQSGNDFTRFNYLPGVDGVPDGLGPRASARTDGHGIPCRGHSPCRPDLRRAGARGPKR
jgi:hypothetical protein